MPILDDFEAFESPKLLIENARKRIEDFEALTASFIERCNYTVFKKLDLKTGENVGKIRLNSRLPGQARTVFSGALADLRHALDQALCDGSAALGVDDVRSIHFPFSKDKDGLSGQMKRHCRNVPIELRAFAERLQPYMGGDSFLWAVSSIAGPGKHQRSINVAPLADGMIMHGDGLHVQGPATFGIGKMSDLRNEFEFARFPAGSEFHMKFDIPLQVVIGDVDVVGGQPALSVLNEYVGKVESIVLGIEAETARVLASRP